MIQTIINFALEVKLEFMQKYIYHFTILNGMMLSTVILGFVFIHLMTKESRYAWLIAAYNCAVLTFVWGERGIIGQMCLYIFYVFNASYAFIFWSSNTISIGSYIVIGLNWVIKNGGGIEVPLAKGLVQVVRFLQELSKKEVHSDGNGEVVIKYFKPLTTFVHLLSVAFISMILITIINYFKAHHGLTSNKTVADFFLLTFSLYALLIQVRKYVESWAYFTIIDYCVFIMYIKMHLFMLALVRGYIATISAYGFVKWIVRYRARHPNRV